MTPLEARAIMARINAGSLRGLGLDAAYTEQQFADETISVVAYSYSDDDAADRIFYSVDEAAFTAAVLRANDRHRAEAR